MNELNAEILQEELQDFIMKIDEGIEFDGLIRPYIDDLKQRLLKYIE